jgi:hypothetical protein
MKKILGGLVIMSVLVFGAILFAQSGEDVVSPNPTPLAMWDPPTEGSPVVYYVFELWTADPEAEFPGLLELVWSTTTIDTELRVEEDIMQLMTSYRARVRGVDAQDRVGPWSIPSNLYTYDLGEPGIPGEIIWSLQ